MIQKRKYKLPIDNITTNRREQSLFSPTRDKTSDLGRLYPELLKYPEFKTLDRDKLKFCWYYAIYYGKTINEEARRRKAVQYAFWNKLTPDEEQKYIDGELPIEIREGIRRFQSFDIDSRIEARLIAEMTLYNFKQMLDVNPDTDFKDKDKAEDWGAKKQFVDLAAKITELLPSLISQVESGYGVRENSLTEPDDKFIEDFHNSKQE